MRHAWQLAGAALTVWLVAGSGLGWGAVYYVDGDGGDDAHGGTSWADAYQTLTNALAQAAGVSEIWVKAGVYTPTADGNRTKSFVMKTGVDLYGGFAGTETALEERDWTNNLTVLSGDIGAAGDMSDNSYHVVTGATARIDGFTIREGRADGTATSQKSGGGMYTVGAYPITANCIFSNNTSTNSGSSISAVYWDQGSYTACTVGWYNCTFVGNTNSGALYLNIWTNAAGAISNCLFRTNYSTTGSALILNDAKQVVWPEGEAFEVVDTVFSNNILNNTDGGAVRVLGFVAPVVFRDCVFIDNVNLNGVSGPCGGALSIKPSSMGAGVQMTRCRFEHNTARMGAAVWLPDRGGTNSVWRDCSFINNIGNKGGAALHGAIDGTFDTCTFVSNSCTSGDGKGVVHATAAGDVAVDVFTNCSFVTNYCQSSGGGVCWEAGSAEFRKCDFRDNYGDSWAGGLGIYWGSTAAPAGLIDDCLFSNNNSSASSGNGGKGGAIYHNKGDLTITNCRFIANKTSVGGAVYSYTGNWSVVASDCLFLSNSISENNSYGGAWCALGPAHITRSVFLDNKALPSSGGSGGAICYTTVSNATGQVDHCVFRGNQGKYGGAIATRNASLNLAHVTAYDNRSTVAGCGGALMHTNSDAAVTCSVLVENSIFWTNTAPEISTGQYAFVTCRYSNVKGGFAGVGNQDQDPLFVDTTYLHLQSKTAAYAGGYFVGGTWQIGSVYSRLIDAGDPASDWSEEPPLNGQRANMGAYGNTSVASQSMPSGTVLRMY